MKDILKTTVTLDGRVVGTIQMSPEKDRSVFEYDKDCLLWAAPAWELSVTSQRCSLHL